MKKILLLLSLALAAPLYAQQPVPPSDSSIRDLLAVTKAPRTLDAMFEQVDVAMKQAMVQASPQGFNDAQKKVVDDMSAALVKVMQEEMSWEKLEPTYMEIYRRTFTQDEVNAMLTFYRSEYGNALIEKMPQVIKTSTELMMGHMKDMMPRLQQVAQDYTAKLKAAGEK